MKKSLFTKVPFELRYLLWFAWRNSVTWWTVFRAFHFYYLVEIMYQKLPIVNASDETSTRAEGARSQHRPFQGIVCWALQWQPSTKILDRFPDWVSCQVVSIFNTNNTNVTYFRNTNYLEALPSADYCIETHDWLWSILTHFRYGMNRRYAEL